jgi:hypothetical protein
MKLSVIVDRLGNVVGSFRAGPIKLQDGSELQGGVVPGPEEVIHEIDVPEELVKRPVADIHQELQKMIKQSGRP